MWIQQNTTEVDIALELIEMGVPKHDIVIGFNSHKMRWLTDFAVILGIWFDLQSASRANNLSCNPLPL
ncbi:element excision factor XisI family protein [Scytonema sp. NUACC26]|uniref:element excision factor XisI family protein n=1 Tax=Scytonema sp. NUACC26 TaxID=3140176 RepID=UPI0038B33FF4